MSLYTNNEKEAAKKEIVDSIRDLLTLKITLPLGNPNYKLIHTNQFIYLDMPEEFYLANFKYITDALNSSYSRYSRYVKKRWYVEGVTVNCDSGKFTMDLDLNPFPSSLLNYRDGKQGFDKAYTDAVNNAKNNTTNNTNTGDVGGEGKIIDNLVKKIVGKETDTWKKAKLIHKWLIKELGFIWYYDSRYNTPEECYKHRKKLNCADTSRLTASMFRSAGINCFVVHTTSHYYTVFTYKGKQHCSDATSNYRNRLDLYWKSGHGSVKFTGKKCYDKKCGKNPCS